MTVNKAVSSFIGNTATLNMNSKFQEQTHFLISSFYTLIPVELHSGDGVDP